MGHQKIREKKHRKKKISTVKVNDSKIYRIKNNNRECIEWVGGMRLRRPENKKEINLKPGFDHYQIFKSGVTTVQGTYKDNEKNTTEKTCTYQGFSKIIESKDVKYRLWFTKWETSKNTWWHTDIQKGNVEMTLTYYGRTNKTYKVIKTSVTLKELKNMSQVSKLKDLGSDVKQGIFGIEKQEDFRKKFYSESSIDTKKNHYPFFSQASQFLVGSVYTMISRKWDKMNFDDAYKNVEYFTFIGYCESCNEFVGGAIDDKKDDVLIFVKGEHRISDMVDKFTSSNKSFFKGTDQNEYKSVIDWVDKNDMESLDIRSLGQRLGRNTKSRLGSQKEIIYENINMFQHLNYDSRINDRPDNIYNLLEETDRGEGNDTSYPPLFFVKRFKPSLDYIRMFYYGNNTEGIKAMYKGFLQDKYGLISAIKVNDFLVSVDKLNEKDKLEKLFICCNLWNKIKSIFAGRLSVQYGLNRLTISIVHKLRLILDTNSYSHDIYPSLDHPRDNKTVAKALGTMFTYLPSGVGQTTKSNHAFWGDLDYIELRFLKCVKINESNKKGLVGIIGFNVIANKVFTRNTSTVIYSFFYNYKTFEIGLKVLSSSIAKEDSKKYTKFNEFVQKYKKISNYTSPSPNFYILDEDLKNMITLQEVTDEEINKQTNKQIEEIEKKSTHSDDYSQL